TSTAGAGFAVMSVRLTKDDVMCVVAPQSADTCSGPLRASVATRLLTYYKARRARTSTPTGSPRHTNASVWQPVPTLSVFSHDVDHHPLRDKALYELCHSLIL